MTNETRNKKLIILVSTERPIHNFKNMLRHYIGNDIIKPFYAYDITRTKHNEEAHRTGRDVLTLEEERKLLLQCVINSYRNNVANVAQEYDIKERYTFIEGVNPANQRVISVDEQRERYSLFNQIHARLHERERTNPSTLTLEEIFQGSLQLCNLAESDTWDTIRGYAERLQIKIGESK